jgi:hypothetical protein
MRLEERLRAAAQAGRSCGVLRVAAVVAVLMLASAASADAKVRCGSGTTAFVEGELRIFGVYFHRADDFNEEWGFDEYACLGRGPRPQGVGLKYSNTGTGSDDAPAYAYDGKRYLAVYHTTDGEGGPSAQLSVRDLRTRRDVGFVNVACCEGVPAFRVASDGTLVALTPGEDLFVKRRGRRAQTLSTPGAVPKDLAMTGATIYWSEGSQARSARLDGVSGGEALMLEPVRLHRRGGACAAAPGRTIAASGSIRVVERGARRFACRIGGKGRFAAGVFGGPAPRIVGDRWLLVRGEGRAEVVDSRTGRTVTAVGYVASPALLRDGTLAWIDFAGALHVRRPGADPVVLAATGASSLAAARRAIYWTENGHPRRYRP